MPRYNRHHDIYDDTRHHHGGQLERHPVPVIRRRGRDHNPHSHHGAVMDPMQDMDGAMRRLNEDMDRAFGGFGFGSMFGQRGMMASFDRMFDDVMSAAQQGGNGTYYYESKTRTVGPDGRVHEEHVRTVPDEHGRPQTRRTVRDADSEGDLDPFYLRSGGFGHHRVMHDASEPEVVVEEVDDDEPVVHDEGSRRRSRRHHGDVEVEEIEEPRQRNPLDWVRDRYRRRYRH